MSKNRLRPSVLFLVSGILPFLLYSYVLKLPFMCDAYFGVAGAAGETYSATETHRVDNPIDPAVFHAFPQTVPWWTSPDARLLFLRPLVTLSARIDYLLWGKNPVAFHFTNLFFHCLSCAFLFLVGRRLLKNDWAAFLAVFVFSSHLFNALVVSWVAERASVMSLALGLAGLYSHIRYRAEEKKAWELAAWLLFILAFLARESGSLCLIVYFLYDVFLWRKERADRWPGLFRLGLTYAVLCIPLGLFIVYFKVAGYGVKGHYSILDEGVPALGVFAYILKNFLLYVFSMLFFLPVTHEMNRDLFVRPLFFLPLVALLVLAALFLFPGFRSRLFRDRRYPFLVSWLFVSLLPTIQLLTQNRYVYSAMAPFGLLVSCYLFGLREAHALGRATRVLFAALALYFAVFPMAGILWKNDTLRRLHSFQSDLVQETLGQIGKPTADRPTNVFFINMPNSILVFALQYAFDFYSEKGAVRVFPLTIARDIPAVELLDDRSMRITTRAGPFLKSEGERLFMSGGLDREGMTCVNDFFRSTIETVEDGGVRSIRFDFASPLDGEDSRFFFVQNRHVHPARIPPGLRGELPLPVPAAD
jgi:hypothetical protein